MSTMTSPYLTAQEALEALADQHETHGPGIHTRARITYRGGRKVGLYISRAGERILGAHRTNGNYAVVMTRMDDIVQVEYAQQWLRDERGPLFVAEGV